jgi:hypothetical protein
MNKKGTVGKFEEHFETEEGKEDHVMRVLPVTCNNMT